MKFATKNIHIATAIVLLLIMLISSCDNQEQFIGVTESPKAAFVPPVKVSLDTVAPPKKVFLKNVPPPRFVRVPDKVGGFNTIQTENGKERIQLKPPVINPAQMPEANFTNFNTEQGLASANIYSGMMDKKGQLWFSTGNYISRYDGSGFSNFTVGQGSPVNGILEDKNGNFWFSTWGGGICRYDGVRITNFTTLDGLAHNMTVQMIQDRKGDFWISTYGGGINRYDGKNFTTYNTGNGLASDYANQMVEDKNGHIWIGTLGGGVSCFDGTRFTTYTTEQGLANNNVFGMLYDKSGKLWFGTEEGVSFFDPSSGSKDLTTIKIPGSLSNNVNAIAEDRSGNIWFATIGGGVCRFDARLPAHAGTDGNDTVGQGTHYTIFTTEQGLTNNTVTTITEDKNGNLWFGTDGGGLSRYNGKSINVFTSRQGLLKGRALSIGEDSSGKLWLGNYQDGICCYDGEKFIYYTTAQGLPGMIINCIMQDSIGNLWIGAGGGISRFDGKSFTSYTDEQGLSHNAVNNVMQDKKGNIWCGTHEGASRLDLSDANPGFTNFNLAQGIPNKNVNVIVEGPDGDLWMGTEGGGVSRFDGKSFTTYTEKQGLAHNVIESILKDKSGNLWFGTAGGVSRFDGSGFISFTAAEGLADDLVSAIVEDEQGVIWFGTAKGFCSLQFKKTVTGNKPAEIRGAGLCKESNEQLKFYEPVWEIYNNQTGYPVKDFSDRVMYIKKLDLPYGNKENAGMIWGGISDSKVFRFDPAAESKNTDPPVAFIRSVRIDETAINWYSLGNIIKDSIGIVQQEIMVYGKLLTARVRDSLQNKFGNIQFDSITPFYQLPENLVLPYRHNRVSIDFGAIETSRNFMVRYQYILKGYDKEWSPVTNSSSVTYGNIREGSNTFILKARSPEGIWSEPVSYSFEVLPPWWRTWWMYLLYAIMAIGLVVLIVQWNGRRLRARAKKLEKEIDKATAVIRKQKQVVEEQKEAVEAEKKKSDELLLNILPAETADELKATGAAKARDFNEVTVLFTDFKNFTRLTEQLNAHELVSEINYHYSAFDNIISRYGIEKIKTIGDSYMCAGGLPVENKTNAEDCVGAALEFRDFILQEKKTREAKGAPFFEIRIGLHTGPVVAGIVGIKKYAYDIWGDTVNIASRMESSGEPGKVNISGTTYELVKDKFTCTYRGKIDAKNKGVIDMYFVEEK